MKDKLHLYVVFVKEATPKSRANPMKVYGIDINENNVTVYAYPDNKAITIVTNFSKVVLGYIHRRARIQQKWSKRYGVKSNRRFEVALRKLRERNVKKEIKLRLAKTVIDIANDGVVVLEIYQRIFKIKLQKETTTLTD